MEGQQGPPNKKPAAAARTLAAWALLVVFWLVCVWVSKWSWDVKGRRAGRPSDRPGFFDRRDTSAPGRFADAPSAATSPTSTFPSRPASWSAETERTLAIFDEIVRSRNDNDPRLDQELRNLSPEVQAALREKYQALPPESRNSRGLVVFLLGRGVRTPSVVNLAFFKTVLAEPECLSLADCLRPSERGAGDAASESQAEMGLAVTLTYPQRMALRMIERSLRDRKSWTPEELEAAEQALLVGRGSSNAWVAKRSSDLLGRVK